MRENKHVFGWMFFISIFFFFSSSSYAAGAGIQDKEKPVLAGITHEIIFIGQAFTPLEGVIAKDNVDGNITRKIVVSGKVNTKKAGKYVLTYTVYDKAKNKAMAVRTITVIKDTVDPELSGVANKSIYISKAFDPLFDVTAMDNADGDVTSKIEVSGRVNEKKAGKYKLTYSVSDKAGNIASRERIVTVIDNIKPVFSGVGDIELFIGESFHPLKGVTAFDNNDGDLTRIIKVSGYINTRILGVNTIIYSVKDKAGNKAEYKRTVTVKEGPSGYLEFNVDYISPDNGMTVKMGTMTKKNLGEFYEYSVSYTQKNNTNEPIPELRPKIYYTNDTYEEVKIGSPKTLKPGESVTRGYRFKMVNTIFPYCIEYAKASTGQKPLEKSLKWEFQFK